MRTRMLTVAATAATLTLGAAAAAEAQSPAPAGGTLYLQQAEGGTLKGRTLTLHGVGARTTTFQDRPQRRGGSQRTKAFVAGFDRAFGDDPPNAALEVDGAPAGRDVALLELSAPRYDARERTLTYTVAPLRTTKATGLQGFAKRADGAGKVREFGRATLFVDDGTTASIFLFEVQIPTGTSTSIQLTNGTFDPSSYGVVQTNIGTPAVGQLGQIAYGEGQLQGSTLTFTSATGGGGLSIFTIVGVATSASTLTGTATVPAGATIGIQPIGGATVPLTGGAFSVPVPSS